MYGYIESDNNNNNNNNNNNKYNSRNKYLRTKITEAICPTILNEMLCSVGFQRL